MFHKHSQCHCHLCACRIYQETPLLWLPGEILLWLLPQLRSVFNSCPNTDEVGLQKILRVQLLQTPPGQHMAATNFQRVDYQQSPLYQNEGNGQGEGKCGCRFLFVFIFVALWLLEKSSLGQVVLCCVRGEGGRVVFSAVRFVSSTLLGLPLSSQMKRGEVSNLCQRSHFLPRLGGVSSFSSVWSWAPTVNIYFCLAVGCWKAPEVLNDTLVLWAIRNNTLDSSEDWGRVLCRQLQAACLSEETVTCYTCLDLAPWCDNMEHFVPLELLPLSANHQIKVAFALLDLSHIRKSICLIWCEVLIFRLWLIYWQGLLTQVVVLCFYFLTNM